MIARGLEGEHCSSDFYMGDSPVKRIRDKLHMFFPTWTNNLPPGNMCCLTATDNIFGRLVNAAPGAADSDVCTVATHCGDVTGEFAHIEQKDTSRDPANYDNWGNAISAAFVASSCSGQW